jgi:hypothetical protein
MASKVQSADFGTESGANLKQFGECATALKKALYQDAALSDTEFLFMDNHFQVLQMAYLRWKRKHRPAQLLAAGNKDVFQGKAI